MKKKLFIVVIIKVLGAGHSQSMIIIYYYERVFFKFYVMGPTEINLYGIAHVKVDFILLQKKHVIPRVGRFV